MRLSKNYFWLFGCLGVILFGAITIKNLSFDSVFQQIQEVNPTPTVAVAPHWERIESGLDRLEMAFSSTTGSIIVLYRLSPKRFEPYFTHALPPKHVSVWGAQATDASLLVNGVYFQEDYLPSGFFEVSSTRIGLRKFDQDKTGMMMFDPFRIIDTKVKPVALNASTTMIQSYPFLIKNGMMSIAEETGRLARRTFVGLDRDGSMYVGVAPYAPLTLFQLGQFLVRLPVAWTQVLNLDGGPSTGLWVRQSLRSELFDSYVPVPNILFFRPKKTQ